MYNSEFIITGLYCTDCTKKVQLTLEKVKYIHKVEINTMNQRIYVESKIKITDKELNQIRYVINTIESGVEIFKKEQEDKVSLENKINYKTIFSIFFTKRSIIFALLALSIGFTARNYLSFNYWYLAIYVWAGYNVIIKAIKNLRNKIFFDENTLMLIATIGAYYIGDAMEAIAVMLFYKAGEVITEIAVNKSRDRIKSILQIKPKNAIKEVNGKLIECNPSELKKDDIVVIKVGEKIPTDGIILEGESEFDSSCITGESMPLICMKNDQVLGGYINLSSVIKIKITTEYKDSAISKIIDLIENASSKKTKTELIITKFAKIYTPIVVILALIMAVLIPQFTGITYNEAIYNACVFLVISCPCALVISIPLTYFYGLGIATKEHILFNATSYIETMGNIDAIAFDKTGTITKGQFEVSSINGNLDIIKISGVIEKNSSHPLSKAISNYFDNEDIKNDIKDIKEIAGKGISAIVDNKQYLIGNYRLMEYYGIKNYEQNYINNTVVHIAYNDNYEGYIILNDIIKEESIDTISYFNKKNIHTVMLTGDNESTAKRVKEITGIDECHYDLLPEDKYSILEKYISQDKCVAFVGDGVNDAPSLKLADIGISMGVRGSDLAIDAADVIIKNDDISKIKTAYIISKNTRKIAKENITLSLVIKVLILSFGLFGLADMWMAILADVGVTLLVILNSLKNKV